MLIIFSISSAKVLFSAERAKHAIKKLPAHKDARSFQVVLQMRL